jgi:predicted DNA binding protein
MVPHDGGESESPVVEIEFRLDDPDYPFVGVSEAKSCEVELQEMTHRGDGTYAEFYSIRGADVDEVAEMAETHAMVTPTVIEAYDDGGLVEFTVAENCPAVGLAELGALPRTVYGENGKGRIVAELPSEYDAGEVISSFQEEYDGEFVAKREQAELTPLFSQRELDHALDERLTDRQREVLEFAFEAGYYEWPREITGEELAEQLDISQPTLSEHLSAAERTLLSLLLEQAN